MKLNIRQKLLVALATLLIATAGIQQLYNRQALIVAANKDVNRFETTVAQVQINGLKSWLDTSAAIVSSAKAGFAGAAKPEVALAQAAQAGHFDMIYVGTDQGQMIASTPNWKAPDGYDPRQRPWYQDATAAGRMTVTAPYADASSGQLIISLAEPMNTGTVKGVIAGDISINNLVTNVNSIAREGV